MPAIPVRRLLPLIALALAACGSNPIPIAITISPASATVAVNGSIAFTDTIEGTLDEAVVWSILEDASGGSITQSGVYTAPANAGTYHVVVDSHADPLRTATAAVVVTPAVTPVAVSISPTTASVLEGGTQTFTATVTGSSNTAVTWSVREGVTGGAVSSAGVYTAPATSGVFHVVATSSADATKSATAAVTVGAPPAVTISITPVTAALAALGQQQFTAVVTSSANEAVTWTVDEPAGGMVDTNGLYKAPNAAGTFHVRATSAADTAQFAEATVTVAAPPAVTVAVSPKTAALLVGATQQFTATVSSAADTSVKWTVLGSNSGMVSDSGSYMAPTVAGIYTVQATSNADNTKSDTATVTVTTTPPPVVVTVTPAAPEIATHGTVTLAATVTGSSNSAVTWSIPIGSAGSVDLNGHYLAPATAGTYAVRATSAADSTAFADASVKVDSVAVTVAPASMTLGVNATQQFTATVLIGNSGPLDQTVTWSVSEGVTGGVVTQMGVYTAPSAAVTAHVIATSKADTTVSASATVTVMVQAPQPPPNVVATAGNEQVTVSWGSSSGAVSYNVYFAAHGDLATSSFAKLTSATSGVVIGNLENTQLYDFAVTAVNSVGESADSTIASATPLDTTPPAVISYWPGANAVGVSLTAAPFFELTQAINPSTLSGAFSLTAGGVAVPGALTYDGLRATFTPGSPLAPDVVYTAAISTAVQDTSGNAFSGFSWTFTTQSSSPNLLTAIPGYTAVTLLWNAVAGATSYTVYRSTVSGSGYVPLFETKGVSFTDIGNDLSNGTMVYYVVTANSADGESEISNEVSALPSNTAVQTPSGLAATATNGQVILSWAFLNFSLNFSIYRSTTPGGPYTLLTSTLTSASTTGYQYTDNTVVNGTTYYYAVSAEDASDHLSSYSTEVSATPTASTLAAPTMLTHVDGDDYVQLSWQAVPGASGYVISRNDMNEGGPYAELAEVMGSASTSYLNSGLNDGTTYYYVVAAYDANNLVGSFSSEVVAHPSGTGAPLPPVLTLLSAYNSQVSLSWTVVPGAASYQVMRAIGNGTPSVLRNDSENTYLDTNLSDANTYNYSIVAVNGTSTSTSNTVTAMPMDKALVAPTSVVANGGPASLSITWASVPGATSYQVSYGTAHATYTSTVTASSPFLEILSTGITNGTTYYLVVAALGEKADGGGAQVSANSEEVSVTPLATLPAAPGSLSQTSNVAGNVSLGWAAVTVTGNGDPITYNVYRNSDVDLQGWFKLNAAPLSVTTYSDNTVVTGASYNYSLTAIQDLNEGIWSQPSNPIMPLASGPLPPTNVTAHTSSTFITLSWDVEPGAASYAIYSSTTSGGPYGSGTFQGSAFPAYTVAVTQPTYFTIATNFAGNAGVSARSPEILVTPDASYLSPPAAEQSLTTNVGDGRVELNWNAVTGATSYNIYRTTALHNWALIGTVQAPGLGYVDTAVTNSVEYYYAVASVGPDASHLSHEGAWWSPSSGIPTELLPTARALPVPPNIVAYPGNDAVTVRWDPVPAAADYKVNAASQSGGPYINGGEQAYSNAFTFTPTTLPGIANGAPLFFVVSTFDYDEELTSGYSPELMTTPSATLLSVPGTVAEVSEYDGIQLTWAALTGATGYRVYRSLQSIPEAASIWTLIGTPSMPHFTDTTAINSVRYDYAVSGVASGVEGPWYMVPEAANALANDLLPPNGLHSHPGNGQVTLTWDAVTGVTSYTIATSSVTGGPYTQILTTSQPGATVTLNNGVTAYYVVTSSAGPVGMLASGLSLEVSATSSAQLPAAPTILAPAHASGQVTVNWNASTGVTSYLVYRYAAAAADWLLIGESRTNSYIDTTVTAGTPYVYAVAAANGNGVGAWSAASASVTP